MRRGIPRHRLPLFATEPNPSAQQGEQIEALFKAMNLDQMSNSIMDSIYEGTDLIHAMSAMRDRPSVRVGVRPGTKGLAPMRFFFEEVVGRK
jgi:hypothetical protein